MREIQATQAKARLAELLTEVERGESIAITRHGTPVAHLVPVGEQARLARIEAFRQFMDLCDRLPRTKVTLDEILAWRHEGHRY